MVPHLPAGTGSPQADGVEVAVRPDVSDYLKPIDPPRPCVRSASGSPRSFPGTSAASPRVLRLLETRTPHEGHGLANALRHVLKRPDLAAEVEALLPDDGGELPAG